MNLDSMMTPKAIRQIEARMGALREAEELLKVIVIEWQTDPMSVQCFDSRVVERAKRCVATLEANPRVI